MTVEGRLGPARALGVPAHITLLYPFAPPSRVDQPLLDELAGVLADVTPFELELAGIGWFGQEVVWAEPRPLEPFLRLIELLAARWPEFPPYQATIDDSSSMGRVATRELH